MSAKQVVKRFFESDFYKNEETLDKFIHEDFKLYWNSSAGYSKMDKVSFKQMLLEMSKSFKALRCVTTHLLEEDQTVTVRYTYHIKTIESPEDEMPLAHFISIFEVEGEKLKSGYQISQPADETPDNMKSFLPKNNQ